MIRKILLGARKYIREWSKADLHEFNKFIINKILRHLFKFDNILPFGIVFVLLALSVQSMSSAYILYLSQIFLHLQPLLLFSWPWGFGSLIYPFIIIIVFNYIGYRLPFIVPQVFYLLS